MTRKKFGCFKIVLVFFFVFIAVVGVWLFSNVGKLPTESEPLFAPSIAANGVTSPLNENGDVDYVGAVNERASEGITPAENAVVKFVQAIGPEPEGVVVSERFFETLGISPLPTEGNYYQAFEAWQKTLVVSDTEAKIVFAVEKENGREEPLSESELQGWAGEITTIKLDFVQNFDWAPEDFPEVEKWRLESIANLETFKQGLQRDKYYYPIVPTSGADGLLISSSLGYAQVYREYGRFFEMLGGRALAKSDPDAAFDEALNLYKLASLCKRGSTLVEELIAIAIQGRADQLVNRIIHAKGVSAAQLKNYLKSLDSISSPAEMVRIIDRGERMVGLDCVQHMFRHGIMPSELINGQGERMPFLLHRMVDAEAAMTFLNHQYDVLVQQLKRDSNQEVRAALQNYEARYQAMEEEIMAPITWAKTVLGGRRAKGEQAGRIIACMMMPAIPQVHNAELRVAASLRLLKLTIAVELFKRKNQGKLPATLDELVPEFRDCIPADPFTGKAFVYKPAKDGQYLLYSVGDNEIDEQGQGIDSENEDLPPGDDWQLTIPKTPTWKEYLQENIGHGWMVNWPQ